MPNYVDTGDLLKNIKLLEDQWGSNLSANERKYAFILSEMAAGRQLQYRSAFMQESDDNLDARPKFSAKLFGLANQLSASLYNRSVIRNSNDRELWNKYLWKKSRVAMAESDSHAWIGGQALIVIKPIVDAEGELIRFKLFSIPAYRWVGLADREDPGKVAAVRILWSVADSNVHLNTNSVIDPSSDNEWLYLDDTYMRITNRNGTTTSEHGLGYRPFVCCSNTLSTMQWKGTPAGGYDMIETLRTLNMTFEQIIWVALLSRGQLVKYGEGKEVSGLGPTTALEMDSDSRAEYLRQNADITGMLATFQTGVNLITACYNLPSNFFNVVSIQPPSSAAVLQVSSGQLETFLKSRSLITREWESELHYACSKIGKNWGLNLNPEVDITYPTTPLVLTPQESITQINTALDQGLISKSMAAIEMYPYKPIYLSIGGVEAAAREKDIEKRAMETEPVAVEQMESENEPPESEDE